MVKTKRPKVEKNIVAIVISAAIFFLAAGAVLGLLNAGKIREIVKDQFNEEQIVIARHVSGLIVRDINFLKKEILLLRKYISKKPFDPSVHQEIIQQSLSRVLERGVWKVEVVDLIKQKRYAYVPYRQWTVEQTQNEILDDLPPLTAMDNENAWVSRPAFKPSKITLKLAIPLAGDSSGLILFHVNVSWFLNPFLEKIHSGKTGYAWLIDDNGTFLFHPMADFIGKNAFEIRGEKYPNISYAKINFIQKDKMLTGMEGTGWYFSGWHRGITGQIKKLIAYSPVMISESPLQRWSIAVVAPISEIEDAVQKVSLRQFLMMGLVILIISLGAAAILFFEMRWTRRLENKVDKRTEELKRSEEKYRSLVESAEDFIFTIDSEGHLQSVNSFTANFFGGCQEDFLGKPLSSIFPENVAEKQLKLVKLVYNLGKSLRDEFELQMEDHRIWISSNFMPIKNEAGKVVAILCIARDVTENKNLERQLIHAEKLASLGTLAAGVAHEINNPLGVILGFSDLLLRKTDKDTQAHEDLKTIERQGLHCKQVVENLLSFARLGRGEDEYSDLNHCLGEIIKVVKHTLEISHIELVTELDENIPLVRGDSRELQQVFLNLINNAIAAMRDGGVLTIRTKPDKGRRKTSVQFHDTGVGIKEKAMDYIFEPFFTTKPEGEGTGLGLFVSYGIITKYGGSIDCVSHTADAPGKVSGTTFTVKLVNKPREG